MVFPLKIQYRGVIKRAQFTHGDASKDKDQTMSDMYDIVKGLFDINQSNDKIQLTFIDDENDSISFSSDRELVAAFALVKSEGWKTFKINVQVDVEDDEDEENKANVAVVVPNVEAKVVEPKVEAKVVVPNIEAKAKAKAEVKVAINELKAKPKATFAKVAPKATFVPNINAPAFVPSKMEKPPAKKSALSSENSKPQKVPLRATSGGAYIYPDGTVEFGMGGEAVLLPDGQTVSCTLSYRGFPSVAAAGTVLTEGKWYYEAMVLTDGLMQIGWCDTKFEGNSTHGEGVGDDTHSIAYDGKRKLKWHNGRSQPFGERWKAGDVVCCAANLDDGVVQFALNGKWNDRSTAFDSLIFHDGLMPAASFSKGEKLCFNFGSSANNGFVHSPPDEEYLPVYIAQGNVNTMEKMEKMMQEQQEKKGKAKSAGKKTNEGKQCGGGMFGNVPNENMQHPGGFNFAHPASGLFASGGFSFHNAPPPPYTRATENNNGEPTVNEQFIALLLKDDVRAALSRFLANPQVALMIQHVIVAVLSGSTDEIQAQMASIIPLIVQLGSEAPALLGLIPLFMDPNFISQFRNRCGGGPTARSNEENTNENSNPYSNAQYPPPPPGFFGGRRHHPPPHHRNPWTRNNHCGGKRGHGRRGGRNRCPWRKGCKGGRWAREQQQNDNNNNNNNNAANMPQQNNVDESPVATFGKMMSNALNATGGQAMKWVGEMCENPSDKKFSTDLQKAINQSLKETQPVYQQKPPVVNDTSSSENLNKKPAAAVVVDPNAVRPRAKFVEQFAIAAEDGKGEEHVSLSTMLPGEKATHVWKMVNPSEADAWPKGVYAKSVGGDDFVIQTRQWNPSAIVEPKATVDIVVDAIAPEKPGRYIHYWRLHDSNNVPFGDRIWLDMTVVLEKPAVAKKEEAKVVAKPVVLKKEEAPPAPSSTRKESDDELTAALIGQLLEEDSKRIAEEKSANMEKEASVDLNEEEIVVLPESENNIAIGVEESKNGEQEDDAHKKAAAISAKEEEEEEKKVTALEHVERVSNLPNIPKLDSDAVSTTSSTSTSMSNPDEQWDLLHSSSFTDDFTTTAESMMQVQKYQTQLDQLSAMGFSNRDALIKLLDEHQGDVQKVINSFVSSK